jgi:hypothetical protein
MCHKGAFVRPWRGIRCLASKVQRTRTLAPPFEFPRWDEAEHEIPYRKGLFDSGLQENAIESWSELKLVKPMRSD